MQTTTSDKDTWYWTDDPILYAISLLKIDMLINKFEYTTIQEVDPVDMWAILGAIGGVWRKCTLPIYRKIDFNSVPTWHTTA